MSALLTNNASGGTNGTNVTVNNSGQDSGDAWTFVSVGAGASMTYTNSPARGGLSYRAATTGTTSYSFIEWGKFPEGTDMYFRFNMYLAAFPASSFRPCEFNDGTATTCAIGVNTTGKIVIRDSGGSLMLTSAMSVPTGRWFRIEGRLTSHATAGQIVFRLYTEVDSPYPAEKITSAASFNTKPNAPYTYKARFGISTGLNVANQTVYLDDIGINNSGYFGPADATYAQSLLRANNAETGSNGTTVTLDNAGSTTNTFISTINTVNPITYSNAQASHGSLSFYFQPTNGGNTLLTWAYLATLQAAARVYIYFTALPAVTTEYLQISTNDTGTFEYICRAGVTSTGQLALYDNSTLLWTSTATMATNTWYRIELAGAIGGTPTTGTANAAFYLLDNGTALDSHTTNTANTGTSVSIGIIQMGKTSPTSATNDFYMDGFMVQQNTTTYVGPYSGPLTAPPAYAGIIPHVGWGRHI